MGIRTRVILSTLFIASLALALSFGLVYYESTSAVHEQEQREVAQSLDRAAGALNEKVTDLNTRTTDWSVWDALYQFAANPASSPGFVRENVISPQHMAAIGVDVFVVADKSGRVLYSSATVPETHETTAPPKEAVAYATRRAASPPGQTADSRIAGLMNTSIAPMMVVAQPILHSDSSGPVAGTLLFGRFVDKDDIAEIGNIAQMQVAVYSPDRSTGASGFAEARESLRGGAESVATVSGPDRLSGFRMLGGLGGDAVILAITLPRTALAAAREVSLNIALWVLVVVGVTSGSLFLTLDHTVIRRLTRLSDEVSSVATSDDLTRRVASLGGDEIGALADEINVMLASVESGSDELRESNLQLERMVYNVAESMGRVVEARDPYTQGHQERVSRLAGQIAHELDLSESQIAGIEFAGVVHDIGKLGIPAEILTRPGHLSATEMSLIREHSLRGHEILSGIEFPWPIDDIVLQHHERMDGSGYPSGLVDTQIMLEARIIAVADVVEAMASHRPYRPSLGLDAAIEYLRSEPEKFDPDVVAAVVRLWESGQIDL